MSIAKWTPFIRYALMILSGLLVRGGWLPEDLAAQIAEDPAVIELATGAVVGLVGLGWYVWSKSRAALIEAVS